MEKQLVITQVDLTDLRRVVREAVEEELTPLREEVQLLREKLRASRRVITHKEATAYFDEDVKPATIIEYIYYRGLPAYKNGRKWFIYLEDLFDWQIGRIGFAEKLDEPHVFAPHEGTDMVQLDMLTGQPALVWRGAGDRPLRSALS